LKDSSVRLVHLNPTRVASGFARKCTLPSHESPKRFATFSFLKSEDLLREMSEQKVSAYSDQSVWRDSRAFHRLPVKVAQFLIFHGLNSSIPVEESAGSGSCSRSPREEKMACEQNRCNALNGIL
jgi:hypothetical protein